MNSLTAIKLAHTCVWCFFAGCIVGITVSAFRADFGVATVLTGVVAVEVLVLALNSWRCPLTSVAARHTDDRHANFDIYLPEWLAARNKSIFGVLYAAGVILTLVRWLQSR